jgi:hypothetical protein
LEELDKYYDREMYINIVCDWFSEIFNKGLGGILREMKEKEEALESFELSMNE